MWSSGGCRACNTASCKGFREAKVGVKGFHWNHNKEAAPVAKTHQWTQSESSNVTHWSNNGPKCGGDFERKDRWVALSFLESLPKDKPFWTNTIGLHLFLSSGNKKFNTPFEFSWASVCNPALRLMATSKAKTIAFILSAAKTNPGAITLVDFVELVRKVDPWGTKDWI